MQSPWNENTLNAWEEYSDFVRDSKLMPTNVTYFWGHTINNHGNNIIDHSSLPIFA